MTKIQSLRKQKAFTIIELLLVISIIGILSGVLMVIIQPKKMKGNARDAQRLSDLRVIQGVLEMYFADHRSYPKSCTPVATCTAAWIRVTNTSGNSLYDALVPSYISEMKLDPLNSGTEISPCASATNYRYNYYSDGSIYYLTAIVEDSANVAKACSSYSLLGYGSSCGTVNVCTVVRNP
jgi:prepilin-type N-terminal cleavage/methylation domain-containing protein